MEIDIRGQVGPDTAARVAKSLELAGPRVTVNISGGGTDYSSALEVFHMLRAFTGIVTTVGRSFLSGESVLIWLAGDHRHLARAAHLEFKKPTVEQRGERKDIAKAFERLEAIGTEVTKLVADRTRQSIEDATGWFNDGYILGADRCRELAIATKLIDSDGDLMSADDSAALSHDPDEIVPFESPVSSLADLIRMG